MANNHKNQPGDDQKLELEKGTLASSASSPANAENGPGPSHRRKGKEMTLQENSLGSSVRTIITSNVSEECYRKS